MFSKNNKISKRQMFRLLTFDLMGIGTLLLPTALAEKSGKNGMLSIAIGIGAGVCLTLLYGWVIDSMGEGEGYLAYLKRCFGKVCGTILLIYYALYYLCMGGYAAYVFGHLIVVNLLKNQSFYWIVAGILALAVYGILQGIEGRARVYEILFWFLMVPLFLMLFFAARDVEVPRLFPIYESEGRGLWTGAYLTFSVFSLGGFSLFLVPFAKEKKGIHSACLRAVLFCGILLLALQGILQGMFGTKAMAALEYPVVTLMSMIQIPGGFLQRQDALMVAIWFFTVFALLSSSMFYASENLKALCGGKKERFCIGIVAVCLFGIAVFCYRSAAFSEALIKLFLMIATPLAVGIPIVARVLFCFRKKKKQWIQCGMLLCSMLLLTGCSTTELENRNFPLAMGVDADDDACRISYKFQNLSAVADEKAESPSETDFYIRDEDFFTGISKYANDTNKILDYNHMKVLILSEDFVEDEKSLAQFLAVCEKEDLLARNTLLFFAEDAGQILALDKNLDTTIGSYLEELIESREDYKLKDAVTLGDLYNDRVNEEQLLFVPVLTEEGGLPVIRNYYAVSAGVPKGEVSISEAMMSYLCQGKLKKMSFTLPDQTAVSLERISVHGDFSQENRICYNTRIQLEAKVGKNFDETGKEAAEIQKQITRLFEDELEKTSQDLLDAPGIDMTNSFYKLGRGNKKLYETYVGNIEQYMEDAEYEFEVETILLN